VDHCSYIIQYWNHDSQQYLIFECTNEKLPESDLCIFHDSRILDNDNNRELVSKGFEDKINKYLSSPTSCPLLCIGYHLSDVNIQGKEFPNSVYFDGAFIKGSVNISSKFLNRVSFAVVELSGKGDVFFENTEFSGDISFLDAKFFNEGNVSFSKTLFSGKGEVSFNGSQFSNKGKVDFYNAVFCNDKYVSFARTKFSNEGEVDFSNTQFSNKGYLMFGETNFSCKRRVSFGGTRFSGTTYFSRCDFETSVFFIYAYFMSPNEVRFESEDLSKVSFLNSDITRVNFDAKTRFGNSPLEDRFKIFDESRFESCVTSDEVHTDSRLEREPGNLSFGGVLTSYRYLRENYEYRLRYDEAGQFFIREMEFKRKYRDKFSNILKKYIPTKNSVWRRYFSFIGMYYMICKYGESSKLPVLIFAAIILLSTSFWYISTISLLPVKNVVNGVCKDSQFACFLHTTFENCSEHLIFCSLERTFSDVVGFPDKGIIIDYATRISSLIVLATLFLPLRRKFERRFRH
jgi:uncharacterized protein YjbI with pentapeptide repeats